MSKCYIERDVVALLAAGIDDDVHSVSALYLRCERYPEGVQIARCYKRAKDGRIVVETHDPIDASAYGVRTLAPEIVVGALTIYRFLLPVGVQAYI